MSEKEHEPVELLNQPKNVEPAAPRRQLPMDWIIWTAVAAGLGLLFLGVQALRTFGTPCDTVSETLETLMAADTKRLRKDKHLGLTSRADREVDERGTAEYNRILAIFNKARRLGRERYYRSRSEMWRSGEAAFKALPYDSQTTIRNKSKKAWLSKQAFASLTPEEQKTFGSAEVLTDRSKLQALAYKVAKPNLTEEDKALIGNKDPESEQVKQDPQLKAIVARAKRVGMAVLGRIAGKANRAAKAEFWRLSRGERRRITRASRDRYIYQTGLDSHADKSLFKTVKVLLDPDTSDVSGLQRSLGLASLESKERADIKRRNYVKFVAARETFIETKGTRLYRAFLKETFPADCCKVSKVRYVGGSGRSLLRNESAVVVLGFGPVPADVVAKARKKDKEAKVEHPAKEYLGAAAFLSYKEGLWWAEGFGKDPSGKITDGVGASVSSLKNPGAIVSVVLLALLAFAVVLTVALRRSSTAIACAEGATAVMLLAVVQVLLQGQITLDDVFFTPLYMAVPVWIGMNRGAESGFMAGFITGLGLTTASALVTVAPWAAIAGNELVMQEHFLAILFLAVTGAAAGRLRWPAQLPVVLPLLWMLFYVGLDRELMLSLNFYSHALLGCAVVGLGMLLLKLGVLDTARRVFGGGQETR